MGILQVGNFLILDIPGRTLYNVFVHYPKKAIRVVFGRKRVLKKPVESDGKELIELKKVNEKLSANLTKAAKSEESLKTENVKLVKQLADADLNLKQQEEQIQTYKNTFEEKDDLKIVEKTHKKVDEATSES